MQNRKIDIKSLITLVMAFFAIILVQSMVFMSFDDYGYGALNYAVGNQFNPAGGTNYSMIDIFNFLKSTYMVWAGRILYQFFLIGLLRQGEWLIQIAQSVVIFLTIFFTAKAFSFDRKEKFIKSFIIILAAFYCIPIIITKLSLYWYCASVIYFWPFMFFMAGLCLINRLNNSNKSGILTVLLVFLGIASGWSQEQVGMAFCAYLYIQILWDYVLNNRLINKNIIAFFISNVIGYIILIIAPGNFARMKDGSSGEILKRSIFETVFNGMKSIIDNFKNIDSSVVYIAIIICLIILLMHKVGNNSKIEKLKKVSIVFIAFTELVNIIGRFIDFRPISYYVLVLHIIFLLCGIIIYILLYKDKIMAGIVCAAIASLIPALVSPYYVDRMLFPMCYIFVVGLFILINNILSSINGTREIKYVNIGIYILILCGGIGYLTTLAGYFENSIPKNINNFILKENSERIKNGEEINTIYLYKNINEKYTGTQPYEVDYTGSIKSYFDIPQDVQISIEPFPEENPIRALKILYRNGIKGLENINNLFEIDAVNNKKDVSKQINGFYNLESYGENSFYWIEKKAWCKLQNDRIAHNGIKIKLNADKEKLQVSSPKIKIIVNDVIVREEELLGGEQEINIQPNEIQMANDNIYKIQLEGDCDFSPKEIGEGEDSRRLFVQLRYLGNN